MPHIRPPDPRPGWRLPGFRRQAAIVFRVDAGGGEIGRVLYGGRDLTALAIEPDA